MKRYKRILTERWRGPIEGPRYVVSGMNKTGTSSVRTAMEALGLGPSPRYLDDRHRHKLLIRAITERGDYRPAMKFARHYRLFKDRPWNVRLIHREFDRLFPGSKFVLSVRDPDSWWTSVEAWLERYPERRGTYKRHLNIEKVTRDLCIEAYEAHNNEVRRYFARTGRLLEMDLKQGHEFPELCEFLELPLPDVPFPHLNQQDYSNRVSQRKERRRKQRNANQAKTDRPGRR